MKQILLVLLMTCMLASCSSKPNVTAAGTYVEMKTELAKLQLYKNQLQGLKSTLTDVPSNVYSKDWKPIELRGEKLNQFLTYNDCGQTTVKSGCYETTRLLLIATTKELDKSSERINALNAVVDQLIKNIDLIISNLNDQK